MPNYIGVDVGKVSLECYIPTTNNVYKVPNDNKGFLLLLKYLKNYKPTAEEKLVSLTKRREQLILMKNQEICRLETEQDNYIKKSINQHIAYLEEKIKSANTH